MKSSTFALALAIVGLMVWPLSYAWIPSAGRNPAWMGILVPVAEWGAIGCSVVAIWSGIRARRAGERSIGATWAPRVGGATLALMSIAFFVVAASYRDP